MKKIIPIVIISSILSSTITLAATKIFFDVPANSWYSDSVYSLAEKGIIEGYADGTYKPENFVNRAELAVMLNRLIDYLESDESTILLNAKLKCLELNGDYSLVFNENTGFREVSCNFGNSECSQNELVSSECWAESNPDYQLASKKCIKLGGEPYFGFSSVYNEDQIFCTFGSEGQCTQNGLLKGLCFKAN